MAENGVVGKKHAKEPSIQDEYFAWRDKMKKLAKESRKHYIEHYAEYPKPFLRITFPHVTEWDSPPPPSSIYSNLDNQLADFLRKMTVEPGDKEYKDREAFIEQLEQLLQREFPNAEVYPFGSFLTGLCDKDSDIDIYANLHNDITNGLKGDISWAQELDQLEHASRIIHQSGVYINIEEITQTRVPIIKFEHKDLGIKCDLSFKSLLSYQNSRLIRLYTQIDPRTGALMRIVRYWAKFHGFCGSLQIKTYALNLMVLFFFMRKKFVPTVRELQTLNGSTLDELDISILDEFGNFLVPFDSYTYHIAGWNGGFFDNPILIKEFMKKKGGYKPWADIDAANHAAGEPFCAKKILGLLLEFMELFASFDYYRMMVCTLTGKLLQKATFSRYRIDKLPLSYKLYKDRFSGCGDADRVELDIRAFALCVQDPFILNFNVGLRTKPVDIENWQFACTKTMEAIENLLVEQKYEDCKLDDIFVPIDFDEVGSELTRKIRREFFLKANRTSRGAPFDSQNCDDIDAGEEELPGPFEYFMGDEIAPVSDGEYEEEDGDDEYEYDGGNGDN